MCGICGELTFDSGIAGDSLAAMTRHIWSRGPDATPKGHSKLWQFALLDCWLQTQGI
jgi:asparagine synthetase B (glutamine-hydrolysing)